MIVITAILNIVNVSEAGSAVVVAPGQDGLPSLDSHRLARGCDILHLRAKLL